MIEILKSSCICEI